MKSLPQPAAVFCPALIGISQSAFAHAVHNLKFGVPPDKTKGAALKYRRDWIDIVLKLEPVVVLKDMPAEIATVLVRPLNCALLLTSKV